LSRKNVQKYEYFIFENLLYFHLPSKYDQAIAAYNDALEIVDTNSELWSDIISNLAGNYLLLIYRINDLKYLDIHRKKGNYNEARDLYLKSLQHMESLYGQNHPSIADIMNNLGILLKKEGKYNEALDYLKRALRISKHYYGQDHPSIGIYLTNVGDIQRKVAICTKKIQNSVSF
jgi:tetratricopeptide (TPR) repeat protein